VICIREQKQQGPWVLVFPKTLAWALGNNGFSTMGTILISLTRGSNSTGQIYAFRLQDGFRILEVYDSFLGAECEMCGGVESRSRVKCQSLFSAKLDLVSTGLHPIRRAIWRGT